MSLALVVESQEIHEKVGTDDVGWNRWSPLQLSWSDAADIQKLLITIHISGSCIWVIC